MVPIIQLFLATLPLQTSDQRILIVGGHYLWIRSGQIDNIDADCALYGGERDEFLLRRNGNVIDRPVHVLNDLQELNGGAASE